MIQIRDVRATEKAEATAHSSSNHYQANMATIMDEQQQAQLDTLSSAPYENLENKETKKAKGDNKKQQQKNSSALSTKIYTLLPSPLRTPAHASLLYPYYRSVRAFTAAVSNFQGIKLQTWYYSHKIYEAAIAPYRLQIDLAKRVMGMKCAAALAVVTDWRAQSQDVRMWEYLKLLNRVRRWESLEYAGWKFFEAREAERETTSGVKGEERKAEYEKVRKEEKKVAKAMCENGEGRVRERKKLGRDRWTRIEMAFL